MSEINTNHIIKFENVYCSYKIKKNFASFKTYTANRDITFDILEGETLGVVGKNGAGKSTLLKLMAGILVPTSGKITKKPNLSISLLSIQAGFFPNLSGKDNAILGAMYLGYTKKEAISRLPKIIEFSELDEWIDEPLRTYSSGMKARLGFAVAMEIVPDVLLVDEVLGVGDEYFRTKSTNEMKKTMQSKQTVVFVSHQVELIEELCHRTIWLNNGQIKKIGKTKNVLQAYHKWNEELINKSMN